VTLQLWSSLLDRRGYQVADGEVILSPSKVDVDGPAKNPEPEQAPASPTGLKFGAARSVLSSFRRANSFAPAVDPKNVPGPSRQLPFRRTSTSMAALGNDAVKAGPSKVAREPSRENSPGDEISGASKSSIGSPAVQIFVGMKLRLLGEMKSSPNVRNAILQLGGTLSADEDEDVDFIVVRLVRYVLKFCHIYVT
jgi:DNA replication regulator DPB11